MPGIWFAAGGLDARHLLGIWFAAGSLDARHLLGIWFAWHRLIGVVQCKPTNSLLRQQPKVL
jgi:hypothetical protein